MCVCVCVMQLSGIFMMLAHSSFVRPEETIQCKVQYHCIYLLSYMYIPIYYRILTSQAHQQRSPKRCAVDLLDLKTLLPGRGVSDAVVDFCVRYV